MKLIYIAISLVLFGCASNGIQRLKTQGYTDQEIKKMTPYYKSYATLMSRSFGASTTLAGSSMVQNNSTQLREIYCNCIKKLKN